MTEFAHAVNYTISFGITVFPEDINKTREWLKKGNTDSIYNIEVNGDSSDEDIAKLIGLQNRCEAESLDMEMEDYSVYDAKDTARLIKDAEDLKR